MQSIIPLTRFFLTVWILFSLLCSCNSRNGHSTNLKKQQVKNHECIESIRSYVDKFETINEWSLILKDELNESTEGGELTYYNWDGKLIKIEAIYYGETFQKLSRYYLRNDSLIYIYEKELQYNRPIYQDSVRMHELNDTEVFDLNKARKKESRAYFCKGQLIDASRMPNYKSNTKSSSEKEQIRIEEEFNKYKGRYKAVYNK